MKRLNWLGITIFLLIFVSRANAITIECGQVLPKDVVDHLRKELEYEGSYAELHCAFGTEEIPYRFIRVYRHKKSDKVMMLAEDKEGVVREIYVGSFDREKEIDFKALKWVKTGSIKVNSDAIDVVGSK